jgi:LPXTG-motif cell wall-anchored protein
VLIGEGNTTLILLIVVAALLSIIGILLVNKRRQPHPTQNQVLDKTPKAALKH